MFDQLKALADGCAGSAGRITISKDLAEWMEANGLPTGVINRDGGNFEIGCEAICEFCGSATSHEAAAAEKQKPAKRKAAKSGKEKEQPAAKKEPSKKDYSTPEPTAEAISTKYPPD